MTEKVAIWCGAALFTVALFVLIVVVFRRRVDRATREGSPGAWTGACVDLQQSRAWSALVMDDTGLRVRALWGKALRYSYRWSEIDVPASGRAEMSIGVRTVEGLRIQLVEGSHVDLLLPSRNLVRYPKTQVDSALKALQHHRSRAAGSWR